MLQKKDEPIENIKKSTHETVSNDMGNPDDTQLHVISIFDDEVNNTSVREQTPKESLFEADSMDVKSNERTKRRVHSISKSPVRPNPSEIKSKDKSEITIN